MERLTIDEIIEHCDRKTKMYEKACDIKCLETAVMGNGIKEYWEHKQVAEYLRKFKDYEDLEEQGRLMKLPCKVGDTIYGLHKAMVCELDTETIGISKMPSGETLYLIDGWELDKGDFGKTVFLTKSEAEAKLKELRGGENE